MKMTGDVGVYVSVLAVSLFMVLWSLFGENYGFKSWFLPVVIGSAVVLLCVVGLIAEMRPRKTATAATEEDGEPVFRESWSSYLVHILWVVGFMIAIYLVGFLVAIPIFLFLYTRRLGGSLLASAISCVAMSVFVYVAFELVLEVQLYPGLLFSS